MPHNSQVNSTNWGSFSFLFGPVMAFVGIGVLVLFLRWGWSRGHSLVATPVRPGAMDDYGVLVAVSTPANLIEGEVLKQTLINQGVRATLALTNDGPRVMVWPEDADSARTILRSWRG